MNVKSWEVLRSWQFQRYFQRSLLTLTLQCDAFLVIPSLPQVSKPKLSSFQSPNLTKVYSMKKNLIWIHKREQFFHFSIMQKVNQCQISIPFHFSNFFSENMFENCHHKKMSFPMLFGDKWICLMLWPINLSFYHLSENSLIIYG